MIAIQFNGEDIFIQKNISLQTFLEQNKIKNRLFAIAINNQFVSKKNYEHIILSHQDVIEMIIPMQGG